MRVAAESQDLDGEAGAPARRDEVRDVHLAGIPRGDSGGASVDQDADGGAAVLPQLDDDALPLLEARADCRDVPDVPGVEGEALGAPVANLQRFRSLCEADAAVGGGGGPEGAEQVDDFKAREVLVEVERSADGVEALMQERGVEPDLAEGLVRPPAGVYGVREGRAVDFEAVGPGAFDGEEEVARRDGLDVEGVLKIDAYALRIRLGRRRPRLVHVASPAVDAEDVADLVVEAQNLQLRLPVAPADAVAGLVEDEDVRLG